MDPPPVLSGSCSCGLVTYSSRTLPLLVTLCLCRPCRKLSGAPFLPWALYRNSALTWRCAAGAIRTTASEIAVRGSCSACASPLFIKYHCRPHDTSVTLGSVDDASVQGSIPRAAELVFLAEKPRWWDVVAEDGVAGYEGFDEAFDRSLRLWMSDGRKPRADV